MQLAAPSAHPCSCMHFTNIAMDAKGRDLPAHAQHPHPRRRVPAPGTHPHGTLQVPAATSTAGHAPVGPPKQTGGLPARLNQYAAQHPAASTHLLGHPRRPLAPAPPSTHHLPPSAQRPAVGSQWRGIHPFGDPCNPLAPRHPAPSNSLASGHHPAAAPTLSARAPVARRKKPPGHAPPQKLGAQPPST